MRCWHVKSYLTILSILRISYRVGKLADWFSSLLSSLLFSSLCFPNWMWCRYVDLNKVRHNSEIKIKIFTAARWEVRSEGTLRDPGPPHLFIKNRRTDKIPKNRTFWTQKRRSFWFFSLKMQRTHQWKRKIPHTVPGCGIFGDTGQIQIVTCVGMTQQLHCQIALNLIGQIHHQ